MTIKRDIGRISCVFRVVETRAACRRFCSSITRRAATASQPHLMKMEYTTTPLPPRLRRLLDYGATGSGADCIYYMGVRSSREKSGVGTYGAMHAAWLQTQISFTVSPLRLPQSAHAHSIMYDEAFCESQPVARRVGGTPVPLPTEPKSSGGGGKSEK
jgi:hypothetical protein